MRLRVCAYNLGNGQVVHGNVSKLEDVETLHKIVNPTGENDVETELLETDTSCVTQQNLFQFLELVKKFPDMREQDIANLIYYEVEDIESVLNGDRCFYYINALSKEIAFEIYFKENVFEYELNSYADFIDWERMFSFYEASCEIEIIDIGSISIEYDGMFLHKFLVIC